MATPVSSKKAVPKPRAKCSKPWSCDFNRLFSDGIYKFNALSAAELTLFHYLQEASKPKLPEQAPRKPKLHLFGKKRSGKSSIRRVVFHGENAADTLYIESTTKLIKEPKTSWMEFDVHDYPSLVNVDDYDSTPHAIFTSPGALVWVVDAQDEYTDSIERFIGTLYQFATVLSDISEPPREGAILKFPSDFRLPSHLSLNVFVHKTDGLSDDFKDDIVQDIQEKITAALTSAGLEDIATSTAFYQTSIYDYTIFDSLSKVVQKLIRPSKHATLESLINSLCSNCKIEKAYLFDIQWKIYIASDTTPQDMQSFETCCDHLDMVRDLNKIHGWREPPPKVEGTEYYDDDFTESLCVMERPGYHYLFLKGMTKHLSLACIMGEDSPTEHQALIEKNMRVFQKGLKEVLDF